MCPCHWGGCPAGPLTRGRDGLTPLREFATGRLCSAEADCNNDCKTRAAMSSTEGMVDPAVDVPGVLPVAVTTDVVVTAGVLGLLVVVAIMLSCSVNKLRVKITQRTTRCKMQLLKNVSFLEWVGGSCE